MNVDFGQVVDNIRINEPLDVNRQEFIKKTFLWLFIAILGFAAFEFVLFQTGVATVLAKAIFSFGQIGWLVILGGFVLVGTLTTNLAHSPNRDMQILGFVGYIIAEGIIFCPLLYVAQAVNTAIIPYSAAVTFLITGVLCTWVISFRTNFSFLKPFLATATIAALGLIVVSAFMGFHLGLVFSIAMVLLACAYILYTMSNIIHEYDSDSYIGAATELFASVALLFWYIVRIAIELAGRE